MFDDVPLVGNERREDYNGFFAVIAAAESPSDAIDWLLLKDLVDLSWEIRRERRIRAGIVKLHQITVISDLLKSSFGTTNMLQSAMNRIFHAGTEAQSWANDEQSRKSVELKLKEKGYDADSVLAQAYLRGARDIDAIDNRITRCEVRRNGVLKEIARRNERKAQKLARTLDFVEAEFSEAAE
jgi:hypothetical protein